MAARGSKFWVFLPVFAEFCTPRAPVYCCNALYICKLSEIYRYKPLYSRKPHPPQIYKCEYFTFVNSPRFTNVNFSHL